MEELLGLVEAAVRRFETERDEPWHHVAHTLASELAVLIQSAQVSPVALRPLLAKSGGLPASETGAQAVRRSLVRAYFEVGGQAPPAGQGDLVIDDRGRLSILAEQAKSPSRAWVREQDFAPIRALVTDDWWSAYPYGGGALLLAGPYIHSLGPAPIEWVWDAVPGFTVAQVAEMVCLFPVLAERVPRPQ